MSTPKSKRLSRERYKVYRERGCELDRTISRTDLHETVFDSVR